MKLFNLVRIRPLRLEALAMDLQVAHNNISKEALADNRETDEFINEFYLTRKQS